jgi:branched-chain amino acid transport system ATP-binding protein
LNVEHVTGGYGDSIILNDLSIHVDEGEIVVLIGPNGAGKSTVMKAVFGLAKVREGSVTFDAEDITRTRPDRIVRQGLGYVPQEYNVFPTMSVQENLEMGAFTRSDDYAPQMARMYELFPDLADKRKTAAGSLSGGQRQMVAFARALMMEPKLIMLDEPTAGLSPLYMEQIFAKIGDINRFGTTVLLVEQNARQALAVADRGYVLVQGHVRYHNTGANLLADPEVGELFLGGGS